MSIEPITGVSVGDIDFDDTQKDSVVEGKPEPQRRVGLLEDFATWGAKSFRVGYPLQSGTEFFETLPTWRISADCGRVTNSRWRPT